MMAPAPRPIDVLSVGRACLDLYAHEIGVPMTGVSMFNAFVGGCPANVVVGTRRLGLSTMMLSAVGDDQVGDFVVDFLRREGVRVDTISRKPGRRTGAALLTIVPPETFTLTYYRDNCADLALGVGDVDAAPIADARVLFLSGTGLSGEPSATATHYAAERARTAGTVVVVDLDYRPTLWSDAATFGASARALLRNADLAIGTEDEIRAAAGGSLGTLESAERLLATGVRALVMKRGPAGARLFRAGEAPADARPFTVDILNVLGAGDAFASGFLYAWLTGASLERAMRFGNATGAIVVTRHGCANDMPTLHDVEAFIASQGGW